MRATRNVLGWVGVMLFVAACGGSTGSGNGSASRASDAACQGASCPPAEQVPAPLTCGGQSGTQCPQGYRCVADPAAACQPADDATCTGTCVLGEALPGCGADRSCPDGFVCTTNADATGVCSTGAADCAGTCRPKATGQCTSDAECPQPAISCSICADGTASCPTSRCEGGQCNVGLTPCAAPPPPSGCATMLCAAGFHCVEDPTCAPDAADCKAACIADEPPAQCGGIAGQPCPPGMECVDDPSDTCDPATGGADCPGMCQSVTGGECKTDADCPQLPAPCSVCADGTPACPRSFCDNGKCNVDVPTCVVPVSCGSDGCQPGTTCTDDPTDTCDPASGALDCPGICVPDNSPLPCTDASMCPPGYECTSDPAACLPDATGQCAGMPGVCVLPSPPPPPQCASDDDCVQMIAPCTACPDGSSACPHAVCKAGMCATWVDACVSPPPPPQCASDSDCVQMMAPCTACPDGSYACPHAVCKAGACAGWIDACVSPGFCGGIAGLPCPPGSTCIDDPTDGCDPQKGGADCGGICVREDAPPSCAGFTGASCPAGYECVDDPNDNCDPANGGADCPGICRPAPSPKCSSDADCPVIGAPCRMCADGTAACPKSFCSNGLCAAEFKTCAGES